MPKRKLPLWMRDSESSPVPDPRKRVLSEVTESNGIEAEKDSNVKSFKVQDTVIDSESKALIEQTSAIEDAENTPRRRLRSNFKISDEIPKQEPTVQLKIEDVPYIEYKGRIEYFTDMRDIAFACDQLVQWVDKQPPEQEQIPIAFDLEWPFSFQTGPGRVALMQLCADTDLCYLFQISCLKKLPAAMLALLNHPRVQLHGVNVKNDFRKLARDYPEAYADKMISQCVDLGQWYNLIYGSRGIWSMERLVLQVCRLRISKNKKVRMSKWHVLPLSDDQKMYAAIDVYIGQEIYLKLKDAETKLQKERDELASALNPESVTA
ncbi:3'-5' exonuclease [Uranotaenia lowii]|uniref:3'-5' exonuclease n=1 Tax=Uranotaenia lowii TaxID=190385 RepID=UPI0024793321|nr:3'-5' exonuclease [Uranotaenia lowii]